ncbi:MAG TPA: efflux RND transporter periplasmic adaptor subunit, partial [Gemmatirosa sp.]
MRSLTVRPRRLALPLVLLAVVSGACAKKQADAATAIQSAPAARQNIVVDVEATGTVTPINAVDVRSQTSGQITALPVQTGSKIMQGQVLVRIDPRIPTANYNQANAAVVAARSQVQITRTQFVRDTALLRQGVLTAPDIEAARLAYANAQSSLVAAQSQLENARIGIENVVIRAPSAGTVITRPVSLGQVIASSVNSPSGGTVLMTVADLGAVYDSTLVNESDIGRVKPGQEARVTVDAYPGRTFHGSVEKVEPQATVQQSVTFFPVLIRINNPDRALMPGMNTDVSVLVSERDNVLAVPVDAVRSGRDAITAATALGLNADSVRGMLQAQRASRGGAGAAGADTPGSVT